MFYGRKIFVDNQNNPGWLQKQNMYFVRHVLIHMLMDGIVFAFSYWLAAFFMCNMHMFLEDYRISMDYFKAFGVQWSIGQIVLFSIFGFYNKVWNCETIRTHVKVFCICLIYILFFTVISETVYRSYRVANGIYPLLLIFDFSLIMVNHHWRSLVAVISDLIKKRDKVVAEQQLMMIIGAGFSGRELCIKIKKEKVSNAKPVVFIDDDIRKQKMFMLGVPIYGGRDKILEAVGKYNINTIMIAIPSLPDVERRKILEICSQTSCKLLTLPSAAEIISGKVSVNDIRKIDITDLLGREQSILDTSCISSDISGKVILVSGGGGSIGSELCRQVCKYAPGKLIIFDIYENNAYDIENELRRKYPDLNLFVRIGSVRDKHRLEAVFQEFNPDMVFHAAAHKHVPLMEISPFEAMKNNCLGTYNIALTAKQYGLKKFVLISTDKAVNPTNVMGASKRLCEMIIQSLNEPGKTEFVAVRFGNVLGSNGSVVPLFQKLIAARQPLTVTHPEITRYFMTIPEAASLVLQAGAMAKGGEIFILDMGKPFKILSLAETLIKLSGLRPYQDIKIEFTGLRPGEKLYEELSLAEEGMTASEHSKIFISNPIPFDRDKLMNKFIPELPELIARNDHQELIAAIKEMVYTYKPVEN